MGNKNENSLDNINASDFLNEIHKQIEKYCKDHSHVGIITCDVADVYKWLEKAKKKSIKKYNS